MNQETATQIAKQAAQEAVKEYETRAKKTARRRNFRNTRKLMKNYKAIKACVDEGVSEISELDIDVSEELGEDELFIASIRRSKFRSAIMLANIDKALQSLEQFQTDNNDEIKYAVFKAIYIDGQDYEDVADEFNCSVSTARRWGNDMLEKLGCYIFGVDGIYLE